MKRLLLLLVLVGCEEPMPRFEAAGVNFLLWAESTLGTDLLVDVLQDTAGRQELATELNTKISCMSDSTEPPFYRSWKPKVQVSILCVDRLKREYRANQDSVLHPRIRI